MPFGSSGFRFRNLALGVVALAGLILTSLHSYLLFHCLVEIGCIVIACGVFLLAYNSRRILDNNYLVFLGIAYLFVGVLDLFHTLAYAGMGVFPGRDANLPTQLWIGARYVESLTLLASPLFLWRPMKAPVVVGVYAAATGLLLCATLWWKTFPACYLADTGLTTFKILSEYAICVILAFSILHLHRRRALINRRVFRLVAASISLTIVSEICFTLYLSTQGGVILVGHVFKILSFFLIYKAIIETGLMRPYELLFRNLKRSEEELRGARDQLVELNALKDRFLGIAAHDLRNPIAVVQGYLRLLRVDERQNEMKETIGRACRNMLTIIDDLLDLNAIQSGKLKLERMSVALGPFLLDLEESYRLLASRKSIGLRLEVEPGLPRVSVDPLRMGQAIGNLVTNAIHYSHPGTEIVLRARRRGGDEAEIAVVDQGVGIRPEEMPALFTEFGKTSSRPTGGEQSTGLGLAIVKRLVERHGGRVSAESAPGKGSTFSIVLPALAGGPEEETGEAGGKKATAQGPQGGADIADLELSKGPQ